MEVAVTTAMSTKEDLYKKTTKKTYLSNRYVFFILDLILKSQEMAYFENKLFFFPPRGNLIAACAAARRAIGTRYGEQET